MARSRTLSESIRLPPSELNIAVPSSRNRRSPAGLWIHQMPVRTVTPSASISRKLVVSQAVHLTLVTDHNDGEKGNEQEAGDKADALADEGEIVGNIVSGCADFHLSGL